MKRVLASLVLATPILVCGVLAAPAAADVEFGVRIGLPPPLIIAPPAIVIAPPALVVAPPAFVVGPPAYYAAPPRYHRVKYHKRHAYEGSRGHGGWRDRGRGHRHGRDHGDCDD